MGLPQILWRSRQTMASSSALCCHHLLLLSHPFYSTLPHTTELAILATCLWLHSIHKPGQRRISQFRRERPSPNITTSKQISQNRVSVNNIMIRSAAPLSQHKPWPSTNPDTACRSQFPLSMTLFPHQYPGWSWALNCNFCTMKPCALKYAKDRDRDTWNTSQ